MVPGYTSITRQECNHKSSYVVIFEVAMLSLYILCFFFWGFVHCNRKLEEKKLKCKQAIDTTDKVRKENVMIKNEVIY